MDDEYISRNEHNAFASDVDHEQTRQNKRIEALEVTVRQINTLHCPFKSSLSTWNICSLIRQNKASGLKSWKTETEKNGEVFLCMS